MSKQQLAQTWSQIAADFDQIGPPFFAQSGRQLVTLAQFPPGAKILDVAAGRGAILFPAAEQVGRNGRVVSIDLAPGMIKELAFAAKNAHLTQAAVCQMDGEYLAIAADSFDVVLCGHAIFYFPQAANEFWRVLRPGGRVGLSIIAAGVFGWLWPLFAAHSPTKKPPDDRATAVKAPAIDSPDGLRHCLHQAGFEHIQVKAETTETIYADEEEFWANLWLLGTRTALEKMPPTTLQSFKSDLFQTLQTFQQSDSFHIPIRTLFVSGKKPSQRSNGQA